MEVASGRKLRIPGDEIEDELAERANNLTKTSQNEAQAIQDAAKILFERMEQDELDRL